MKHKDAAGNEYHYVVVSTPMYPGDLVVQGFYTHTPIPWTEREDDPMLPNGEALHRALAYMVKINVLNPEVGDDKALVALYASLCHVEGRLFITRRLLDSCEDEEIRRIMETEIANLGPATGVCYGGMFYETAKDLIRKLVVLTDTHARAQAFNKVINDSGWMRAGTKPPPMRASHETETHIPAGSNKLRGVMSDLVQIVYPAAEDLRLGEQPANMFPKK